MLASECTVNHQLKNPNPNPNPKLNKNSLPLSLLQVTPGTGYFNMEPKATAQHHANPLAMTLLALAVTNDCPEFKTH